MQVTSRIAVLAVFIGTAAHAETMVESAQHAFERGDCLQATVLLRGAEKNSDLSGEEKMRAHWVLGACHQLAGRTPEAAREFDALLDENPGFEPTFGGLPRQKQAVLRAAWRGRVALHEANRSVRWGAPVLDGMVLRVPIARGSERVTRVHATISASTGESANFVLPVVTQQASGEISDETLWRAVESGGAFSVQLEAFSAAGVVLARTEKAVVLDVTEAQAQQALGKWRKEIIAVEPEPVPVQRTAATSTEPRSMRGIARVATGSAAGIAGLLVGAASLAILGALGTWVVPLFVALPALPGVDIHQKSAIVLALGGALAVLGSAALVVAFGAGLAGLLSAAASFAGP